MESRPPYWQLIKDAVESLGGRANHGDIINYIKSKYPDANESSIRAQITICTVNAPSRVHYPENNKPRKANGRYDFLYSVGRGEVVTYNPEIHGQWAIIERDGKLAVGQEDVSQEVVEQVAATIEEEHMSFAMESHLRDFLAKNLEVVERGLRLYRDETGRDGVEYPTDVGPIDILAVDANSNYVVFELKLSRGPDKALGQLMRYMGWVRLRLARDTLVRGVIVAQSMDEGLRYAATENRNIKLLEYEVSFKVTPVELPK